MRFALKISEFIKSSRFIRNNPNIRKLLRNVGVGISKIINSKGILRNIGDSGSFMMSPDFTFYDFEGWGKGKNNGFKKLIELANGKTVVFDIGAHIGICTLPISNVLKKGGVCYAFEPADTNRKYLEMHLKMNNIGNIIVVPLLIGDRCSNAIEFYEADADSGMNSICERSETDCTYSKVIKEQITIDHFVNINNCIPELLKIDVEGAELNVLSGARDVLRKYHPEIILSVHPAHLKMLGYTVKELIRLIDEMGYKIFSVDGFKVEGELVSGEYHLR